MATNIPNPNYTSDVEMQENSLEKNQQLQYFLFRIFPFWPLIFLALTVGIVAGYLFLRYATPIYQVKARILINDDSQQKSANLQEIIKLDTRNLSSETEREMEILRSTDMLKKVASQLQLNVKYIQQGNIKSGSAYNNIPFNLELQYPDSIKSTVAGEVKVAGKQISSIDIRNKISSVTIKGIHSIVISFAGPQMISEMERLILKAGLQ